jgi:hypothetical protein
MVRSMSRVWPVAVSVALLTLIVVGCVGMLAGWVPGLAAVTP